MECQLLPITPTPLLKAFPVKIGLLEKVTQLLQAIVENDDRNMGDSSGSLRSQRYYI